MHVYGVVGQWTVSEHRWTVDSTAQYPLPTPPTATPSYTIHPQANSACQAALFDRVSSLVDGRAVRAVGTQSRSVREPSISRSPEGRCGPRAVAARCIDECESSES